MATDGLILGHFHTKISKWQGLKALFDRRIPANRAVRRFQASFKRKQEKQLVRLNNAVHTAVFAPTGVGKGVSIVIPHLLSCRDSMVVVDFKGELFKITAGARRRMGQRVLCIDPFGVAGGKDTFNSLLEIDPLSPHAPDMVTATAAALVIRTGMEHDPFWNDTGEGVIATIIGFVVCFAEPQDKHLQSVRNFLSDSVKFQAALDVCCRSDLWGGMLARWGHQASQHKDKQLSSVLSNVHRHLRFLDTMAVAANMQESTFSPSELLNGKTTIYLVLPPEHMRTQSALLRLWIGSMLRAAVQGGLQEKRKVQFVLDEAASLGRMDALDDAVDKYRGYGVRLLLLYQSIGQLKKCWGNDGGDQTLLSNTTQIFFGVNDNQTAEYVSTRLGEETIYVTSGGTSASKSWQSPQGSNGANYSYSTNDNWSQLGRRLLTAAEIMALDGRIAITLCAGMPPIATVLCRYYEDDFKPQRGMGPIKAAIDAVCMFLAVGFFAVMFTAVLLDNLK